MGFLQIRVLLTLYQPTTKLQVQATRTEFRGLVSSSRGTIGWLWEEFFGDPSMFYDVRNVKKSHKSPDFRHKQNGKGLWINAACNPHWVNKKLQRMELPRLEESTDRNAVIQLIKSCGKKKDVDSIRTIVAEKRWIINDMSIANTLIRYYGKCAALKEAQEVFDQLAERDVVSWNALIAGYAEQGFGEKALLCLREMQNYKIAPDSFTYVCSLKACATVRGIEMVKEIHALVREQGLLNKQIFLGNALVTAYGKCGALKEAKETFDQLVEQDVVSWNALIASYVEHGFGEEALRCFRDMEVTPDLVTYACSLKACAIAKALKSVKEIHKEVQERGLLTNHIVLGNSLVNAYAKCGAVKEAQEAFDQLVVRDVVSWNALISGYAKQGYGKEALARFREMESDGVSPDFVTYASSLKACAIVRSIDTVSEIHAQVREQGMLNKYIILGSALVNAYAKCGVVEEAQKVIDQLAVRNVVTWSALIGGYAEQGFGQEALKCFRLMEREHVTPDTVTYACTLAACATVGAIEIVKEIHAQLREDGLLIKQIVLGNALINAYAKCGALKEANDVFEQLTERDVVSWSSLIDGYTEQGFGEEALACLREMKSNGVTPDSTTYACSLKACAVARDLETVKELHAQVREQNLLNKHIVLGTTLVNAYAKCGAMQEAREVFDKLMERNVVSWAALIAGYAEEGFGEEALTCFMNMENDRVTPDSVTYVFSLKACAIVGALNIVKEIHTRVREEGLLNEHIALGTMLIYAYAKCGVVREAQSVFDQLVEQDIVSWNTLLAGYAQFGRVYEMLQLFNRMIIEDRCPDPVTFVVLLNGCSHGALLEEGERLFHMIGTFGLAPTLNHYTCMVDLLGRAGQFDKAQCFVLNHTDTVLAFLGACCKWVNVDLGRQAFEKLLQLDEECGSAYVSMANIYATAGIIEEANDIDFQ